MTPPFRSLLTFAVFAATPLGYATAQAPAAQSSVLQQHYDRAQSLQSAGNLPEAARQYRLFIADASGKLALEYAQAGAYSSAAPMFDEALRLAPNSPALRVEYARSALADGDLSHARSLAEGLLRDYPANPKAAAKAHLVLGRILLQTSKDAEAKQQFETAVALDPNFENGYALAIACLDLGDGKGAASVFAEMIAGLGDSAALRLQMGRAYLESDFQPDALPEFKKAVTLDDKLPGGHYFLALAYLTAGGDDNLHLAETELKTDLQLAPNDALAHVQLGSLALRRQSFADAERELKSALALDDTNPETYLLLGQLYHATNRDTEAIPALRASIARTKDPSANRYQVQKAHYLLGRLLLQAGHADAGKQEMQLSAALLQQSLSRDRDRLADYLQQKTAGPEASTANTGSTNSSVQPSLQIAAVHEFETRLAPALADSYNNLGVITASTGDPSGASVSFERAAEWNPALQGLDANWGHAVFLAGRFAEAAPLLTRALRRHPDDTQTRSALAVSLFMTKDYAGALQTLAPMQPQVDAEPQLACLYAAALVKTGRVDEGTRRLLTLEKTDTRLTGLHTALGEAYAARKDWRSAVKELTTATSQNPRDAAAYFALGEAQQGQGDLQAAAGNLETAAKLVPGDPDAHRRLAIVYRKDSRPQDANREQALYEELSRAAPAR